MVVKSFTEIEDKVLNTENILNLPGDDVRAIQKAMWRAYQMGRAELLCSNTQLKTALEAIADLDLNDCEEYVAAADAIAMNALVDYELQKKVK